MLSFGDLSSSLIFGGCPIIVQCLSIINNQLHQARLDVVRAHTGTLEDSKKGIDRLVPFVADADSGHGNPTATMKMVKMFVEAGVAAIHLDDLLSGEKNFSAGSMAHVIVPIGEQIRRLLAAKLQLDIMGCVSFHFYLSFCSTLIRSPLSFLLQVPT